MFVYFTNKPCHDISNKLSTIDNPCTVFTVKHFTGTTYYKQINCVFKNNQHFQLTGMSKRDNNIKCTDSI